MPRPLLLLFIIIGTNQLYGQLLHNDPFKIDNFLYLDIEYTHAIITKYKISSVEKYSYPLNKRGKKKGKGTFVYAINFNKDGYPEAFHKKYIMDVWWLYKLNPPKHYYYYIFSYDSLNKLVSIKETIREDKYSHDENDVFYNYDSKGNVIEIILSRKYIYKEGFKYRGVKYSNDTSITKTILVYKNDSIISTIIGESYESQEKSLRYDTLVVNSTFDSLFISKTLPKGVKKDSAGNVIEITVFRRRGKGLGGDCIYSETEADFTTKFNYQRPGVVIGKMYNRNNELIRILTYHYGETGLIDYILTTDISGDKNKKHLTVYKYSRN